VGGKPARATIAGFFARPPGDGCAMAPATRMSFDVADHPEKIQATAILVESFSRAAPSPGILLTLFDFQLALGMLAEAQETLLDLSRSIQGDAHFQYISLVRALLLLHSADAPELNDELERLKGLARENRRRLLLQEGASYDDRTVHQFDLARELILASRLHKSRVLPEADYLTVLQDLCDVTATVSPNPSTVLHVLTDRALRGQEKAMEFLIEQSGVPFVLLSSFQTSPDVREWLPPEFSRHRAALVFGSVGPAALVALLNPYNQRLKQDVQAFLHRPCHFFLTSAAQYNDRMQLLTADA
jgi:hypothetical protein